MSYESTVHVAETMVILDVDALILDIHAMRLDPATTREVISKIRSRVALFEGKLAVSDQMAELSRMNVEEYVHKKLTTYLGDELVKAAIVVRSQYRGDIRSSDEW
jgi:hypothetical protein